MFNAKVFHRSDRTMYAPVLLGTLLCLCLPASDGLATPWAEVRSPSQGPIQVIGGVSNGCIGGADALPETGAGYVSIRRYRNRYYGHPELLRFIEEVGRAQQRRRGLAMMVGDLSQPRGGLMSSSHRSHQNGLDVDIWFTLADSPADARRRMDQQPDPRSMVRPDGLSVSDAWGEDQRFLIETAARHRSVERIFVNPAIKRELCRSATAERGWLRKVRPWKGHDAHFHVRLACPPGSPQCDRQAALPPGDGCGEELTWWFSEEARRPIKKKPGQGSSAPVPPASCRAILNGS
jgi:penicillin-insensitive murein endopeptidase